ncbi:MAG TPA: hypothetical protein ENI08_00910 [Candidatus Dependentiae bacterium]|nr:hypothetical protein [Candidatus Dependentiae bacterium]
MYHFFIWRDVVEILFFSSLFYYLMRWFAKDRSKNLLPYFYGYCFITIIAYTLQLTTISYLLFLYAPAIIMLFMLMHQDILQRNLVTLKNIQPAQTTNHDWLDILFRSCLIMINKNKAVTCVIECTDNLDDLIKTPFFINADLHKGVLELLLDSQAYDADKLVWVSTQGKLRGINASWHTPYYPSKTAQSFSQTAAWQQESLIYAQQTDALIFYGDTLTHTFTIIAQGKCFEKVSPHHAFSLIKKHIRIESNQKKKKKKGKHNEQRNAQKNSLQQRSP